MVKINNKKNITDNKSLKKRILFNKKYSKYNFDDWLKKYYNFNKNQNVLDVGCGDGKQIDYAIEKIGKRKIIFGIDLSAESLEKIHIKYHKFKNLRLINTNMNNLIKIEKEIKKKKFDLIHSTYAIYYSKNPYKLIKYLKSKLKKEARLIITIPGEINTLKKILKVKEDKKIINKNEIERFLNTIFDKLQINILNNYLKIKNVDDVIDFYMSSGIYDKRKLNFLRNYVSKKIKSEGFFRINKSSTMFICYN